MADMIVRIRGFGLRQMERDMMIRANERALNEGTIRPGMAELGDDVVYTLQNNAPFRTGNLSDNIQGQPIRSVARPGVDITVEAIDPETGFNYLNVTRFGRRAVHAKNYRPDFRPEAGAGSSRLARTYGGRGTQKRPFRRMSLRFEPGAPGTGFTYRHAVRAYRPSSDWVGRAQPEVKAHADMAFEKITNDIDYYMKTGARPSVARRTFVRRTTRSGKLR